jgi:predicted nucleic acid-binding protein
MILYLDTSSLVKLYIEELSSEAVRRWAHAAFGFGLPTTPPPRQSRFFYMK